MKPQYYIYTIILLNLLVCFHTSSAQVTASFTKASFQKDSVVLKDINQIHKNIFCLRSNQSEKVRIVFTTTDTDRIQFSVLTTIDTFIQVDQPLYFPIIYKLINTSNKNACSIKAYIYDSQNRLLDQRLFAIHILTKSSWIAASSKKSYFILPKATEQSFTISLYNDGNMSEKLIATINTPLYNKKSWSDSIVLPSKKKLEWILKIPTSYFIKKKARSATFFILVSATSGKALKFPIEVTTPSNTYVQPSTKIDENIYIQADINQLWRNGQTQTNVNVDGKIYLDSFTHVGFQRRQFSLLQNRFLPTSITSFYLQSKNTFFRVGNIIELNDFFIDGWGASFRNTFISSEINFTLVKDRLKDAYYTNWQWKRNLDNNISITPQISTYTNIDTKTQSIIPKLQLAWKDSGSIFTEAKVLTGISRERIYYTKLDTTLTSSMYGYSFIQKRKNITIQSSVLHYGKNYAGANRDLSQQRHSITFYQKPLTVQAFYTSNEKDFLYANDSALYLLQGVHSSETGLSVNWSQKQVFWQLRPSVFTQYKDNTLRSTIYKINYSNRWQWGKNMIAIWCDIGFNEITDQYTQYAYVHSIRAMASSKDIQLTFQWNKNPFYYYDIKNNIDNLNKFSRFDIMVQKYWRFTNTNFFMQSYATFQSNKPIGGNNVMLSHYIEYPFPNCKASIGLLAQWNSGSTFNNLIQCTFRRRFGNDIKSLFLRKKRITLYQDMDGNNQMDKNEIVLANKPVWINNQLLVTNTRGEIVVKKSDFSYYDINLNDVEVSSNWIPTNGYQQRIALDKNTNIRFQKSVVLKGSITITKSKYTNNSVDTKGIQVIIKNEHQSFMVVTDEQGYFELTLPVGNYTIAVDKNNLNTELLYPENEQKIVVTANDNAVVKIILQQKQRAIKINQQ